MMIKAAYFPTIIYAKDVNLDNRLFEKEVLAWADKDKGVKRTNMNGWHSTTNMHEIPVFKPLVDELFKMQNEVFQEEWLESEPHIGNMWAERPSTAWTTQNPMARRHSQIHPISDDHCHNDNFRR